MSLSAAYATYNDKNFCGRSFEDIDSDFFEQFVNFSPPKESIDLYNLECHVDSDSAQTTSSSQDGTNTFPDVWHGEPWSFPQDGPSQSDEPTFFYAETTGRAAVSDSELLNFEDISLLSPRMDAYTHPSLPSSPTPTSTAATQRKERLRNSLSKPLEKASANIDRAQRTPIRKPSTSPGMLRGNAHNTKTRLDLWGQKLSLDAKKFNFNFDEVLEVVSPPTAAKVASTNSQPGPVETVDMYNFPWSPPSSRQVSGQTANYTPISTPNLDQDHTPEIGYRQASGSFPQTPKTQHASASWQHAPESSPLWWNHASAVPMAQPSPSAFYNSSQRATKSLAYQLQNNLAHNANEFAPYQAPNMSSGGLMIQMPTTPTHHGLPMSSPQPSANRSSHQGFFPGGAQQQPRPAYAQRPAHYNHKRVPSGLSTSCKAPRDSESPSPKQSPAFAVRKTRKPKAQKTSTPRTPSMDGAVGFVNYTPSDSRKILTGVAPSGSSKTKARREKEAEEKRRKLSQAAVRAIKAAGGDVGSFVEEGLFV